MKSMLNRIDCNFTTSFSVGLRLVCRLLIVLFYVGEVLASSPSGTWGTPLNPSQDQL